MDTGMDLLDTHQARKPHLGGQTQASSTQRRGAVFLMCLALARSSEQHHFLQQAFSALPGQVRSLPWAPTNPSVPPTPRCYRLSTFIHLSKKYLKSITASKLRAENRTENKN